MSKPTWAVIAQAIADTIATASGLTTIWRYQDQNQPALDYVDLALGPLLPQGLDWVDESYDNTQPAHSQIALTVVGTREVTLSVQVWSQSTVETIAKTTAEATADAIATKLRLPAARDALAAVGVVPFDPGPAEWRPAIVQANFRGRATLDVRCRMPARALQEFADYIASVAGTAKVTGTADGTEIDIPFTAQ